MKEKQNIKQRLQKLKDNQPPGVPDGYFEKLEKDILAKTIYSKKNNRVKSLWKKLTAVAAALAVLLLSYTLLVQESSDADPDVEAALFYLMQHPEELDQESILTLVSLLREDDLMSEDLFFEDDLDEEALIELLDM